jgi:hypothetical protein
MYGPQGFGSRAAKSHAKTAKKRLKPLINPPKSTDLTQIISDLQFGALETSLKFLIYQSHPLFPTLVQGWLCHCARRSIPILHIPALIVPKLHTLLDAKQAWLLGEGRASACQQAYWLAAGAIDSWIRDGGTLNHADQDIKRSVLVCGALMGSADILYSRSRHAVARLCRARGKGAAMERRWQIHRLLNMVVTAQDALATVEKSSLDTPSQA